MNDDFYKKYSIPIVLIIAALGIFFAVKSGNDSDTQEPAGASLETAAYQVPQEKISFDYPKSWGEPQAAAGNQQCPEEDTYRTGETLSIFDKEIRFADVDLPNTDSFIRYGVRLYRMDPNKTNDCNDQLLRGLAKKEIVPETLSSVKLATISMPDFYGVYNERASRLDTEGREQYTLFVKESDSSILVVQPYMSFIPHFGSPELAEMDSKYANDILSYIQKGETSAPIREFLTDFRKMAESIKYND